MKTTVDIPDPLLREAKELAAREGRTLRALIEEALTQLIRARQHPAQFRLRKVSFRGRGVRPEVSEGSWERIREFIYEGRDGS